MIRRETGRTNRLLTLILRVLPLSIFGVVLGHIFAYQWLFPDPETLHTHLHKTGHGYFSFATAIAAIVFVLSIILNVAVSYRNKKSGKAAPGIAFSQAFLAGIVLQFLVFVFMEVTERWVEGGLQLGLSFFESPLLLYGLLFQIVTAGIVAVVLCSAQEIGLRLATFEQRDSQPEETVVQRFSRIYSFGVHMELSIRAPPST